MPKSSARCQGSTKPTIRQPKQGQSTTTAVPLPTAQPKPRLVWGIANLETIIGEDPWVGFMGEPNQTSLAAHDRFATFQNSKTPFVDLSGGGLGLSVDVYGYRGHRQGERRRFVLINVLRPDAGSVLFMDSGASLTVLPASDPNETLIFRVQDVENDTELSIVANILRPLSPAL